MIKKEYYSFNEIGIISMIIIRECRKKSVNI